MPLTEETGNSHSVTKTVIANGVDRAAHEFNVLVLCLSIGAILSARI